MSKTQQQQQQALDRDKSIFRRFEEDIKASIFNVVYILLKDDETTFWKYFLLIVIDFFQILYYAFNDVIQEIWKSDNAVYYIETFLSFFHIIPWLPDVDLVTYLVIFYLCVSLIVLIQLDFFYVNYIQNRSKYAFAWPIQALRSICFLLKTILFLPILETFVSMLVCDNINGTKVHSVYNELQCWSSMHIIHAAFAIISIQSIILLTLAISLTYYKPIGSANDASTKISSRADTFVILEKILLAIFFQFLTDYTYQWVLIIKLSTLSSVAFIRYYTEMPYHNERIGMTFNFLSSVFAWASIVVLISKILEESSFNGSLQLFFLGIPLLFALIVFRKDERLDKLMLSVGNFLRGEEVMEQVRYFIQLVSRKDSDRNCDIILKGYVFQHEDSCPNDQCQLKQFKQSMISTVTSKSQKDKRKKQQQQQQLQMMQNVDNQQLLMQHAKNMYRIGIQKFPTNSYLRITYAFFLIEKMNKKQEAIAELNAASLLNPPIDEQFIIYRYKRLSEEYGDTSGSNFAQSIEERSRSNSKANIDLMTKFAYESNFRQLSVQIERCAQYHLEFWNQLREERPDVAKLGESGQHINQSITHVENIWNQLQKLNSNVPKALRLYGKYLMDILHDKEGGLDLLQRAKDAANIKHNYYDGVNMLEDLNDIQQMSLDGTPCIYVSGDLDKIGMITQSNAGATRIFGYSPLEIRNHNVEKLMPEMYARNHSKILEDALMKGAENIPNKERLVFARHKSGYVFPVWLQLKMVQNVSSGVQFVAMFKIDKKLISTNIGFVLLTKEKKIQGISSSCMRLLNMDIARMRRLTSHGYDLNKLAPTLFSNTEDFNQHGNGKQGVQVEWTIPKFERNKNGPKLPQMATLKRRSGSSQAKDNYRQGSLMNSTNNQDQDTGNFTRDGRSSINKFGATMNATQVQPSYTIVEQKYTLNVTVSSITMGELGEIGYYLRLEQINPTLEKKMIGDGIAAKGGQIGGKNQPRDRVKQPLFQFRFDSDSGRFVRELKDSLYVDNAVKDPNFIDGMFVTPNYLDLANGDSSPYNRSQNGDDQDVAPMLAQQQVKFRDKASKNGDGKPANDRNNAANETTDKLDDKNKDSPSVILGSGYDQLTNEELYHRRKLWSKGIQIYRLVNGKFLPKDGDEETKKEKQIEDERKKKLQMEESSILQLDTFKTNIKSRKALHMAINDTTVPPAIRNLRMTMNIVIACLLSLAITEFVIITAQFKDINENFNMIQKSYGRISEIQRVAYDVRSLILINEGKLTKLQRLSTTSSFTDFLQSDIETALDSIYDLQNYISLSTLSVSDDHANLLNNKVVPLYYMQANTTFKVLNFSLPEAVLQVASAIFTVRHLNLTYYYELEEDVYFVTYNVFNDFLYYLRQSSSYYVSDIMSRSSDKKSIILILFLCSIGLIVLAFPILFPAVSSVNQAKVHVLSLFLDIPNGYIMDIANKCENFLNCYHDDQQMDEMQSEENDDYTKTQGELDKNGNLLAKRGIHKQAKNTAHTNRNFFIQISFAVVALLAYFVGMYIVENNFISDIEILADELNVNAQLESFFSFAQNTQRELLYNPNKPILNGPSFNSSRDAIQFLYNQTQALIDKHHANRNILSNDYQDNFYSIFDEDLCSQGIITTSLLPQSCQGLFNNASIHGLETVISKYYETMRETLQIYKELNTSSISTITTPSKTSTTKAPSVTINNVTYKTNYDLLNSTYFVDLYIMQFRFIQDNFRSLVLLLKNAVNDEYNSIINTMMACFIIYILGLVLAYLILWTPFLGKLNREIWRTKSMLTIIPIEIIMKVPKIQEYLNKQAMFNSKKQTAS